MYVYKIGICGAGTMGAEIAEVAAYAGLPVILRDIKQEFVDSGIKKANDILQRRVDKGKMSQEMKDQIMERITGTLKLEDLKDVDVIIEAIPEDIDLKIELFKELNKICEPHTIFASNTSALSISKMGGGSGRSEKVIGMHFFFPAHVMKLVEVIPGIETSQDTIDTIVELSERFRKLPVKVKEIPGFLVNRILLPMLIEACKCLDEGVASAKDIDLAMQAGAGMPMGPFTLADNLGLDVVLNVADYMAKQYGNPNFNPPYLLRKMVAAGHLGVKTGRGFYDYSKM